MIFHIIYYGIQCQDPEGVTKESEYIYHIQKIYKVPYYDFHMEQPKTVKNEKIHLVFNRVGSNESSIKDLLKEMDQSIPFTVDYIPYDDSLGAVDPSVKSLLLSIPSVLSLWTEDLF